MSGDLEILFEELVALIKQTVPTAENKPKYGGIIFTVKPDEKEGQFCGVFPYDAHVQLSFSKGALLKDTLEYALAGSGKYRRHINFKCTADINKKALKKLISESIEL